jgi:hypothetical protein
MDTTANSIAPRSTVQCPTSRAEQRVGCSVLVLICLLHLLAVQMQEVSLRANLMQAKQRRIGLGLGLGPAAPALATSGWCF